MSPADVVQRIGATARQFTAPMLPPLVQSGTVRMSDPVDEGVMDVVSLHLQRRDQRALDIRVGEAAR